MQNQDLHETLEELHQELERTKTLDDDVRALLHHVMGDIRDILERSGDDADASLIDRLREATRDFEKSHPTLTAAVGRVADALSNMGI